MNEIKVLGNLPKMNKDKKLLCKLRRYSFRNLTEKRTNKKIKGWRGGGTGWLNWWSSSCISPVSSEAWLPPCMTSLCVYNVYLRYCFFEACVCVCVYVCVHWTKVTLTRIPASCFSSILQDLVGKDPLPLCCRLSLSLFCTLLTLHPPFSLYITIKLHPASFSALSRSHVLILEPEIQPPFKSHSGRQYKWSLFPA